MAEKKDKDVEKETPTRLPSIWDTTTEHATKISTVITTIFSEAFPHVTATVQLDVCEWGYFAITHTHTSTQAHKVTHKEMRETPKAATGRRQTADTLGQADFCQSHSRTKAKRKGREKEIYKQRVRRRRSAKRQK